MIAKNKKHKNELFKESMKVKLMQVIIILCCLIVHENGFSQDKTERGMINETK